MNKNKCPECNTNLRHESSCTFCPTCGWECCIKQLKTKGEKKDAKPRRFTE